MLYIIAIRNRSHTHIHVRVWAKRATERAHMWPVTRGYVVAIWSLKLNRWKLITLWSARDLSAWTLLEESGMRKSWSLANQLNIKYSNLILVRPFQIQNTSSHTSLLRDKRAWAEREEVGQKPREINANEVRGKLKYEIGAGPIFTHVSDVTNTMCPWPPWVTKLVKVPHYIHACKNIMLDIVHCPAAGKWFHYTSA